MATHCCDCLLQLCSFGRVLEPLVATRCCNWLLQLVLASGCCVVKPSLQAKRPVFASGGSSFTCLKHSKTTNGKCGTKTGVNKRLVHSLPPIQCSRGGGQKPDLRVSSLAMACVWHPLRLAEHALNGVTLPSRACDSTAPVCSCRATHYAHLQSLGHCAQVIYLLLAC